ncbi:hypothetical protein [Acinetobacter thermotolerans]|uniref:hypothetical protein n=1 Tax=Acinetobacter thermotolerans TaxID=3151487 RepID=UPI00325B5593
MGHIFDLSKYLCKEDLITLNQQTQNRFVQQEVKQINEAILVVAEGAEARPHTDYLYQLSIRIEQFVKHYGHEIKFLHQVRIELLELLIKVKRLNLYKQNLTSELIRSVTALLQNQIGSTIPNDMVHDLMVYETFEYLGLTSELGIQGKLSIAKVRDVETYSLLMGKYKKPKISRNSLEQFFETHRSDLLLQLISSDKSIKHIHYDFDYLQHFISLQLLMTLQGQDINAHINTQVKNALV